MISSTSNISELRLAVYGALEERSYTTVQELAYELDSGTPATQAQVRAVLRSEPEVFWQDEEHWDLAIFHHYFEGRARLFRRKNQFVEDKFLTQVITEALRLKGMPVALETLAEKYLLKISKLAGLHKDEFPSGKGEALRRLKEFLDGSKKFHILKQEGDRWIWTAQEWPETRAVVAAPTFVLPDDFLDRAYEFLNARRAQPTRLLTILEGVLQIDANHVNFSSAFALANASLSADTKDFAQVQEQSWMLTSFVPAEIDDAPARVVIPRWRNPQEEKLIQEVDALPDQDLSNVAEFIEEETPASEAQPDQPITNPVRFVLPYHWRQAGVLKVNARERRLFPDRPARALLQFKDRTTGQTFPVWLNNDNLYLNGLKDWYDANLVPAGGVFHIQRSVGSSYEFAIWIKQSQAHTFDGRQYFCEVDQDTYIEEDRLRDLQALRSKVESAQATVKDVMCDLFESCPDCESMHYKQIWAQVHVVRPTTRRTVAAILSMFPCFQQTSARSGFWKYKPELRDAPRPQVARPARARRQPVQPVQEQPQPQRFWMVPIHAPSWDKLARPAAAGENVFLIPWRGRSRVVKDDQLVFYDADNEQLLAIAKVLRSPVREAASGQREVAVQPLLSAFALVHFADVAGAISVPRPEPDGFPIEITLEDAKLVLDRLTPAIAPKLLEPVIEEQPKVTEPQAEVQVVPQKIGTGSAIADFIARYGRPYDPKERYERNAFALSTKAGKNTPIYNVHSYHTKVPPQGIEPFILHYTNPGDIVLDPFCGSGMTGIAALKQGRRVILNDLSPAATHIAYNYCAPGDPEAFRHEVERIQTLVKEEFDWLYGTTCSRCGGPAIIHSTIWSDVYKCKCGKEIVLWDVAVNTETSAVSEVFVCPACETPWRKSQLQRLRSDPVQTTYECPRCKPKRTTRPLTAQDRELIETIESKAIPYWYPTKEFDKEGEQYKRDALHLRHIDTIADFYTKRNLWALARLHFEVEHSSGKSLKSHLLFWLTSINWLASKMYRYRVDGGGGQQGRLTISALSREQNVLRLAVEKAKALEQLLGETKPGNDYCTVNTGSATNLVTVPVSSVDYVFTDPPFGSNLYYDDLNFLWEGWLGQFTDSTYEAVVHRARKVNPKTRDDYAHLMTESFREMYRVLKPGRWASVVFHNSDDRIWRVIQQAAEDAGFDLVNAMMFDKEQRSFKGTRGEKGLENVTNFDIVLNLHKKSEAQPVSQPEAQDRIERLIVSAVGEHLRSGPAPDYRTGQYLHSLALRTLLNEKISIELTWEQLDRLLQQYFRHINCHWYLPKEAVTTSGHGFLVLSETGAIGWLEHVLSANPQTESDLIPQWQIATLGAGSRVKCTLEELLKENFWQDEGTGHWCIPNAVQREVLKRRRAKPQQLTLGLETEGGPQKELGLK